MNKHQVLARVFAPLTVVCILTAFCWAQSAGVPLQNGPSVNFEVKLPHERMEMTVLTSRIITMEQKIPQAQVNNPDLLDFTALSPTQIQVSAKKAGVTQVNLWDEDKKLYTVDVIIFNDTRELDMMLKGLFPHCALKIVPVANSVIISGYVDKSEHVERIISIAQEFYPKVINNMSVSGVQQVMLHVKLMEVSRTKLRRLGFDWTWMNGQTRVVSSASGLISGVTPAGTPSVVGGQLIMSQPPTYSSSGGESFAFGIVNGASAIFGVLDAMRKDNLLKLRAEPHLVTISGRPATFNAGGEIPVPTPQSLGTISYTWKEYGAKVDFVPIVLGNGKIRLEVRPYVSELDPTNSVTVGGTTCPGIRSRTVETAVEMQAGQTMAIAGLLYNREESENHGLPWISEVPYLGIPFRHVSNISNEIELLVLVTPELVEPMDASEVPQCGPGMNSGTPNDWELFVKGHLEVPNCCPADNPNTPPTDGMIGPEQVPTPQSTGAMTPVNRPNFRSNPTTSTAQVAQRSSGVNGQNRYNSSKPNRGAGDSRNGESNTPPPFVGPVGYDVIK